MDSQIDVLRQGLPGPDGRLRKCHDHKFDPIPTEDYYSLGGIFESTQLLLGSIESPAEAREGEAIHRRLAETNERIRGLFAENSTLRARFSAAAGINASRRGGAGSRKWAAYLKIAAQDPSHPYYPLTKLANTPDAEFPERLAEVRRENRSALAEKAAASQPGRQRSGLRRLRKTHV